MTPTLTYPQLIAFKPCEHSLQEAAAWDAEKAWQFDRLIEWLSDPEPDEWPLPARAQDI